MGWIALGDRTIDSAELNARAQKVASGLESLGVGNADGVAIYLRNDLPFFEASFGASALGAYTIAVNWHCTPDEARYIFEESGAKVVVIHADLLGPIRSAIPQGVHILVVETPPEVAEAFRIGSQ